MCVSLSLYVCLYVYDRKRKGVVGILQTAMQHAQTFFTCACAHYKMVVGYIIPPACSEFMTRGYLSPCLLAVAKFLRTNEIDGESIYSLMGNVFFNGRYLSYKLSKSYVRILLSVSLDKRYINLYFLGCW